MTILLKLRRGQYSLIEEKVDPLSSAVGLALDEVDWPRRCRVVGLIRDAGLLPPDEGLIVAEADEVLAGVHVDSASDLAMLLGPPNLG